MSLGNREGEEDEEAEPEELPDWNAVSSLRETGRRDYFCVVRMPFCRGARRLFICAFSAVNVSRLALSLRLDKVMGNMDGEIPCD